MATLKKKCSKTLSVADLLALAGVDLKKPSVDRSGTDDSNAVRLVTKDAEITFSKADLLACKDGQRVVAGLPMGAAHERHVDGRPHDHVDAAISIDRSGTSDDNAVTLAWLE